MQFQSGAQDTACTRAGQEDLNQWAEMEKEKCFNCNYQVLFSEMDKNINQSNLIANEDEKGGIYHANTNFPEATCSSACNLK